MVIPTEQSIIKLIEEQQNIYDKLLEFIKHPTKKEILLIGYAGTGKTTLMAKFIFDVIEKKECKKIVMAAPTHKAVGIAKAKLFDNINNITELSNNINIMTIHRLLNYQAYIGLNGENYFAMSKNKPNWSLYNVIIVDECSMLSNQIISDIRGQLNSSENNSKVKIIYVGDPAQLPPVNQNKSEIFNCGLEILELNKIIRTNNNNIMELSNAHRKWIFSQKMEDIPRIGNYVCENIKVFSSDGRELKIWLDHFLCGIRNIRPNYKIKSELKAETNNEENKENIIKEEVKEQFKETMYPIEIVGEIPIQKHNENIILTWTNRKAQSYNQYVREKLFNKINLDYYEEGEILIFGDYYRIRVTDNYENEEDNNTKPRKVEVVSFYTSEQVKLMSLDKTKFTFDKIIFKTNGNLTDELNQKFRNKTKSINKLLDNQIDIFKLHVVRVSELKKENIKAIVEYEVLSIHPEVYKKYCDINDTFDKKMLKLKNICYKIINKTNDDNMEKATMQLEVEKKINRLYKEWQVNVKDPFAEIHYGYAITVHKSQGSTFKNVFIDMSDILENNNISETSKCLYTALTRASSTLKLLV